jgi:hypothetical protein
MVHPIKNPSMTGINRTSASTVFKRAVTTVIGFFLS